MILESEYIRFLMILNIEDILLREKYSIERDDMQFLINLFSLFFRK